MNITRKSIISSACGFVLAMGLVVILVVMTMPFVSNFSLGIQRSISLFIFMFSLLVVAPLVSRKLYRIDGTKKIIGWTFIGTGAEFLVFPLSLLFVVKSASSLGGILLMATLFTVSLIIGLLAGATSIAIGIMLIRSDNMLRFAMRGEKE
ncbi:MAG: hypothetical protein PHU34_07530 [Candidatus Methanoperedens sp.]|nr:hypothetical protein [Candidatus Methanoperedens sp.]